MVLKKTPKCSTFTILKYDWEVGFFHTCTQEHDNIWVSQCLHCATLADKFLNRIRIVLINFKDFDSNLCLFPLSFINDPIPTLSDFFGEFYLWELDLKIMCKSSWCDLFFKVIINVGQSEFVLFFRCFLFFLFCKKIVLFFKTLILLLKLFNFKHVGIDLILIDENLFLEWLLL